MISFAVSIVVARQTRKWELISLHEVFWHTEAMSEVRAWLICHKDWGELKGVLSKRLAEAARGEERSALESGEYVKLEKLDQFLSVLMRVRFHASTLKDTRLFDHWIELVKKPAYKELQDYVWQFFPHDAACLLEQRRG